MLFELSPVEAAIAARIAVADGKSVETVRNQLKSVLDMTGCRRQADLARRLAQLIPRGA